MANMTFKTNILPSSDLEYSLGSSEKRWKINDLAGGPIEYIVGTQTSATAAWKGATKDSTLIDGKIIAYKLPVAGTSTAATLELTLLDGTTTGAIPVKRKGTGNTTTHYSAGEVIFMAYDGTNWQVNADYDSNSNDTTTTYARYNHGAFAPITALYRYELLFSHPTDTSKVIPANITSNSTATTKTTITTAAFNPYDYIFYYSTTGTVNANANVDVSYLWYAYSLIDLRYSFNTGSTLVANKDVYLVVQIQSDGTAKLRNPEAVDTNASAQATGANAGPITQVIPTEEDGFVYIKLGHAYDTYRTSLTWDHPMYWYKNGAFRPYTTGRGISDISRSGTTFTVTRDDGSTFTFTQQDNNTWRGIQDNLTSDSTTDSLSAKQGKALANGSARDSTKLPLAGGILTGGLEIKGHIAGDSSTTSGHGLISGGGYHKAYNNILLHGDASTGTSGIAFVGDKVAADGTITNASAPSDRAFIQYHAHGITTTTAEYTDPTLGTSGETGKLVIGIGNDSGDQILLQAIGHTDIRHQMGATAAVIPDTNNTTGTVGSGTQPVWVEGGVIKNTTYTLGKSVPSNAVFTDTNNAVTQINQTGANDYRILLSGSANDTTAIEGANKSTNLRFNPSAKVFSVGGDISATGDLTLTGNANLNSETYAESITAGSLLVNGAANFVNIPTAPTPAATSNDTSIATTAFVMNAFTANDAMVFKGVINANSALPADHKQGWTYRIGTAGTYANKVCEVGDIIICVTEGTAANNDHWAAIQNNIDGAVYKGTNAFTDAHVIIADSTAGKVKDSGKTITATAPSSSAADTTIPTSKAVWSAISGASGYGKTGTVTSITAGVGLNTTSNDTATDGGSITSSGTLYLTKTGVTAGSYGPSAAVTGNEGTTMNVPYITVDKYGRVTSISNKTYTAKNTTYTFTAGTSTLAWNSEVTLATVGGLAIKAKLPANPNTNTDTLVKQTVKTDNVNYKLLATTSASPSSGTAMEATYSANVYANPSTGAVSAVRHTLNVGGTDKAYMAFNSTTNAIDFIFI